MTDAGRGYGAQPWQPDDPLYGDPYQGQGAAEGSWGQYPDAGYPPGTPQQPYPGGQPGYGYQDGWGGPGAAQPGAPGPYADPGAPYGAPQWGYPGQAQDPYGQPSYPGQPNPGQPDPGSSPFAEPQSTGEIPAAESWPAAGEEVEEETHPFFTDTDEDDGTPGSSRAERRRGGGRRSGKRRRSGCACLVVLLALGGVVGTGGYFGYQFWQDKFGPAPDYTGNGTAQVQVEIPEGTLTDMAVVLHNAGVIKSVAAFTDAAAKNSKATQIQPGVYTLRKQMSAAAVVQALTDTTNLNALIIPEGWRASQVYKAIDEKLSLAGGTTQKAAESAAADGSLGLPDYAKNNAKAKDPLEGFLFPSRYTFGKTAKPADVLKQMVSRAKSEYAKYDLKASADKLGLDSPLDVIKVASLVQAEGKTHDDFRKIARVIYNRLKPGNTETNGMLEFDSTYNYAKNQSKIDLSPSELRNYDDPYNTYYYKGLPPGPIGNPGSDAVEAALDPEPGNWYYFVSVTEDETKFAETLAEHDKLVEEFNENQRKKNG